MLFTSPTFLFLFLPLVLLVHYALPRPLRNFWLLLTSLVFYTWGEGKVVMVMLTTIIITYGCALLIDRGWRKAGLVTAVTFSLLALFYYKYFNFGVDNLLLFLQAVGVQHESLLSLPKVLLPIGISFYTFQCLSYTIDVHRGHTPANRSLVDYATYIALFPQLIAGPIVRYVDIRDQLRQRRTSSALWRTGFGRFIVGLFKKTVIANTCAGVADGIFQAAPSDLSTSMLWLGAIAYSLQLYIDFSAYSDMAIGLGRMLGFEFQENFNLPYTARGIKDFWRRWHISLSTWFRDYLYIPLGGSKVNGTRLYLNLFIVFLATGLWHGASWSFVIWGLFHGCFLVLERAWLQEKLDRAMRPIVHIYTLLVVVVGWVIFRANDMEHALQYLSGMFWPAPGEKAVMDQLAFFNIHAHSITMLLIGVLIATPLLKNSIERSGFGLKPSERHQVGSARLAGYYLVHLALLLTSLSYIAAGTYDPFIYFRF